MRNISILIFIYMVTACTNLGTYKNETSNLFETTILWLAESEELAWDPSKMSKILSDTEVYKKKGNFYIPKYNQIVFNHKVLYLGILGIGEMVGPNVTVEGSPQEVASFISREYNLELEASPKKDAYRYQLKKNGMLFIVKHPNLLNASMIIGADTRP